MSRIGHRWTVVLIVMAFALIGTVAGLSLSDVRYVSSATLNVPVAAGFSADVQKDDLEYTDRLLNTYERIAESGPLRASVERRIGTRDRIMVTMVPEPNTEFVRVVVRAPSRALAQRGAGAAADALIAAVRRRSTAVYSDSQKRLTRQLAFRQRSLASLRATLVKTKDAAKRARLAETLRVQRLDYQTLASQAATLGRATEERSSLSVAEPAGTATGGLLSEAKIKMGVGLLFGGGFGFALALLLERRNPRLHTLAEIEEAAGAQVLTTVPRVRGTPGIFNGDSPQQEAIGALRARLLAGGVGEAPRTILVTSHSDDDGRSVVAANLAASLARTRHSVLLIDTDVREPNVHSFFGESNDIGLTTVLQDDSERLPSLAGSVKVTSTPCLAILAGGPPVTSVAEMLASRRMQQVLAAVEQAYDFVVIDTPGLAGRSDAASLASAADAVLLVVAGSPVDDRTVQAARRQLEGVGARIAGVVVNRRRSSSFLGKPRS